MLLGKVPHLNTMVIVDIHLVQIVRVVAKIAVMLDVDKRVKKNVLENAVATVKALVSVDAGKLAIINVRIRVKDTVREVVLVDAEIIAREDLHLYIDFYDW